MIVDSSVLYTESLTPHAPRGVPGAQLQGRGPGSPSTAPQAPSTASLVLVAPAENASDESDDDCYDEVHWT